MAQVQDCERALQSLAERLRAVDPEVRARYVLNRTLACRVPDLDVVFLAELCDEGLAGLRCVDGRDTAGAQVRVAAASDDLLAITGGTLSPAAAWATGRLKIEASVLDLLRLRSLL